MPPWKVLPHPFPSVHPHPDPGFCHMEERCLLLPSMLKMRTGRKGFGELTPPPLMLAFPESGKPTLHRGKSVSNVAFLCAAPLPQPRAAVLLLGNLVQDAVSSAPGQLDGIRPGASGRLVQPCWRAVPKSSLGCRNWSFNCYSGLCPAPCSNPQLPQGGLTSESSCS